MQALAGIDPTFTEIYQCLHKEQQNQTLHDVFILFSSFRKKLSFNWIDSIKEENRMPMLKEVIATFLLFTNDKNTTIRLGAYSIIGTLILTVAPYSPSTFIMAFADAITLMPVSPKISIAIINSFMSLMRFVSPVRITNYVEHMPILHHFSVDVSDFVQYLPQTIPQMKKLPPEFLLNILHSFIKACGKSPNGHFALSISMIVALHRKTLLPEMSKLLIEGKYKVASIWIGKRIFADKKSYTLMDLDLKNFILENAFDQLHSNPLDLSRFDYSCSIIATSIRYEIEHMIDQQNHIEPNPAAPVYDAKEFYEMLNEKLRNSILPKYSSLYRNSLYLLPCDTLEKLVDISTEPDSYRAKKINAITNFFLDYIQKKELSEITKQNQSHSVSNVTLDTQHITINEPQTESDQNLVAENGILISDELSEMSLNEQKKSIKFPKLQNYPSTFNEKNVHMSSNISIRRSLSTKTVKPRMSLRISPIDFNSNAKLVMNSSDFLDSVADQVAEMLNVFVNSEGDLFSTLLDNLKLCMNELLIRCKKKIHISMLKKILSRQILATLNWVQSLKLAQMINSINPDLAMRFIPDYLSIVTNVLLFLSISQTDNLFLESVDSLCNIASYGTLPKILDSIKSSDWYNENIVYRRFYLLAKLAKLFQSDMFQIFVGIAYECLFWCEKKDTFSVIFWFLSKVKIDFLPDNVRDFSFEFVEKHYFAYAHQPIYNKSYVTEEFVDYNSDIVTNPLINHKTALNHLWHCYRFLCHIALAMQRNLILDNKNTTISIVADETSASSLSLIVQNRSETSSKLDISSSSSEMTTSSHNISSSSQSNNGTVAGLLTMSSYSKQMLEYSELKKLYHYSIALVPLFDKFALEMAATLSRGKPKLEEKVWNLSLDTFTKTDDDKFAASCAEVFVHDKREIPQNVRDMLSQFIGDKLTDNGHLLFLCFSCVNKYDHRMAVDSVPIVTQQQWLPLNTVTLLLYKLVKLLGKDIISSIEDKHTLAFLPFANHKSHKTFDAGIYKEKIRFYLLGHHFSEVPMDDSNLLKDLLIFLNDEPKIIIQKPELLDTKHWKFIFENKDCFDLTEVANFIEGNPAVFSKIQLESYFNRSFQLKPVNNATLFASITPFIVQKKEIPISMPLIRSFALFSGRRLDINDKYHQTFFENMIKSVIREKDFPTIRALMNYSIQFRYQKFFIPFIRSDVVLNKKRPSPPLLNQDDISNSENNLAYSSSSNLSFYVESNQNLRELNSTIEDNIFFTDELISLTAKIDPDSVIHYLGLDKDNKALIINQHDIMSDSLRAEIISNLRPSTSTSVGADYYLDYFLDKSNFKKKSFLILIKLLQNVRFSIKKLSDLVVDCIRMYRQLPTSKQHIVIRLITQALFSLATTQSNSAEFKPFMNCLTVQFPTIAMGSDSSILLDFSYLFGFLAEFATDGSFFIEFLNSILNTSTYLPPLFLISTAKLISKRLLPASIIDSNFFTAILLTVELPSNNCGVIRALSSQHITNHIIGNKYLSDDSDFNFSSSSSIDVRDIKPPFEIDAGIQKIVGDKLESYKNSFLISVFLPDFVKYSSEIGELYIKAFLSDSTHPSFFRSLRYALFNKDVAISLFKLHITSPDIITTLFRATRKKQGFTSYIVKYFLRFQYVDVYPLLDTVLTNAINKSSSLFFSKFPSTFDNYLVLFCFLRQFYKKASQPLKISIKKMIEDNADGMNKCPRSRFFSLMMLCNDDPKEVNFGFIVAACETNEFNRVAIEYDKIVTA